MWNSHGLPSCDTNMVYTRCSHGLNVTPTWYTQDAHMVCMWCPHAKHVIYNQILTLASRSSVFSNKTSSFSPLLNTLSIFWHIISLTSSTWFCKLSNWLLLPRILEKWSCNVRKNRRKAQFDSLILMHVYHNILLKCSPKSLLRHDIQFYAQIVFLWSRKFTISL